MSILGNACEEVLPGSDRSDLTGTDSDGCNSTNNQTGTSECKGCIYRTLCSEEAGASGRTVRSDVDFVVTFEELQAMFDAKGIDLTAYEAESSFHDATGAGRGYACAGGVAKAIEECINEYYPGTQVNIEHAEGPGRM